MTRINVVPVQELSDKHLAGEYHEITRVFELARKHSKNFDSPPLGSPCYVLGKGHVQFFYDKLSFISSRYVQLALEMRFRAYQRQVSSAVDMRVVLEVIQCAHDSIQDPGWWNDYEPTPEALALNRLRIADRSPDEKD